MNDLQEWSMLGKLHSLVLPAFGYINDVKVLANVCNPFAATLQMRGINGWFEPLNSLCEMGICLFNCKGMTSKPLVYEASQISQFKSQGG